MNSQELIPLDIVCKHYHIEMSFLINLSEIGLIEIRNVSSSDCVHIDQIMDIEKMIRMHHELEVNLEGIDVVLNLLKRIENLQNELTLTRNRLQRYEDQ